MKDFSELASDSTPEPVKEFIASPAAALAQGDLVDILTKDHQRIEELFKDYGHAGAEEQKRHILQIVLTEISVHFKVEEEIVYPILSESGDPMDSSYEEHSVMQKVMTELATGADVPEFRDNRLGILSELILHHFGEEEKHQFPSLKHTNVDLLKTGQELLERREEILTQEESVQKLTSAGWHPEVGNA